MHPSRAKLGLLGIVASIAIALPILAQPAPTKPGTRDAARVSGGTYTVDHEHTLVRWKVDHLGITPYFGMFGQITGTLVLDPAGPDKSKVDVTIPVSRVITASPGLTQHLLRAPEKAGGKPDFFGPAPADARFVSTSIVDDGSAGNGRAKVIGNLTLNGVTKPVTLNVSFYGAARLPKDMGGEEMVGFEARSTIKRSDFGIDMGIPMVSDDVDLEIVAAFTKK